MNTIPPEKQPVEGDAPSSPIPVKHLLISLVAIIVIGFGVFKFLPTINRYSQRPGIETPQNVDEWTIAAYNYSPGVTLYYGLGRIPIGTVVRADSEHVVINMNGSHETKKREWVDSMCFVKTTDPALP